MSVSSSNTSEELPSPKVDFTRRLPAELRCMILDYLRPEAISLTRHKTSDVWGFAAGLLEVNLQTRLDLVEQVKTYSEFRLGEDIEAPYSQFPLKRSRLAKQLRGQLNELNSAKPRNISFDCHFRPNICACGCSYQRVVQTFLEVFTKNLGLTDHLRIDDLGFEFVEVDISGPSPSRDYVMGETHVFLVKSFPMNIKLRCLVMYGCAVRIGILRCRTAGQWATLAGRIDMTTKAVDAGMTLFKASLWLVDSSST